MQKSLWIFLLAILAGCTTQTTAPSYSYGVVTTGDFSFLARNHNYTYAWQPGEAVAKVPDTIDADVYRAAIRQAIDEVMRVKGYSLTHWETGPAMLIDFGIATESGMTDQEIFDKTQISTGIQVSAEPGERGEKGTLYVAVFDPIYELPRWRVLAQGPTESDNLSRPEDKKELQQIISSMLRPIPTNNSSTIVLP
ncbi:hypothetical protein LNL84_08060 [Vibrio sp. ZSDZ34]|uniref:DUF4136 domain-containing protein n=1 Tax=Vibrio gelatinilyticus TaxID=2893468 RepID=A0A9X1WA39_9VIBR|nr:hypothetical protein [Vibrio gelatinilyticus]MCJ2376788.1 hypothetical protein [Vibrio gelatinilyticus]